LGASFVGVGGAEGKPDAGFTGAHVTGTLRPNAGNFTETLAGLGEGTLAAVGVGGLATSADTGTVAVADGDGVEDFAGGALVTAFVEVVEGFDAADAGVSGDLT
jgi:hypothetical protein